MELGQSVALQRLSRDPDDIDPKMKDWKETTVIGDATVHKVITITRKFQTKIGLRRCNKVTQEVFDRLGECEVLKYADLLGSRIKSLEGLRSTTALLELNIRYTKVVDLRPVRNLPLLRFLDVGSTDIQSCSCLAELGSSLKTLYLDDTEVGSIEEVMESCDNLEDLNVGFTNIPKSLKPSFARMMKAQSRSFQFFNLILNVPKERNASTFEKLTKLINHGFEIDQRCHHKFQGDEEFGALAFYKMECGQATRFFRCDHGNKAMRPTALHFAVFRGDVDMVKKLLEFGANPKLKCWLGKINPCFAQGGEMNDADPSAFEIARFCRREQISRKLDKMFENDVLDWKEQTKAKEHFMVCALNGVDPDETPVEVDYD